jgi:fibronectin type 3 domain-containing protein/uncharacterized protein YkwD
LNRNIISQSSQTVATLRKLNRFFRETFHARASAGRRGRPALEQLEPREVLSGYTPTGLEQEFLERLNDARANPTAYGQSVGVDLSGVAPSQPLAFNTSLIQSSRDHSLDMSNNNFFGHNGSDGSSPFQRMSADGFPWVGAAESIAAGQSSVEAALQSLIVDAGVSDLGHRKQLLSWGGAPYTSEQQTGVGVVMNGSGGYHNYYTLDSGNTADTRPFLLGVIFTDLNKNGLYDNGEGVGGVTIVASGSKGTYQTATWSSGGYSLQLSPGTYTVTASGGSLIRPVTQTVTVGSTNYRLNFTPPVGPRTSGSFDFGTAGSPIPSGYIPVTDQNAYNSGTGYGWLAGSSVASADRGTGTDLTRDFNYTLKQATFAVDLANGTYTVTLQLGDTVYAHQGMGISFQGVQVDNVSTAAGQILTRSYTVTVTNGQLDLGLSALGGLNAAAVIEGMEIVSGKPPPPPTQYDFGTASSPVASGYTGVTQATTYSAATGYGWLSGSVASADRGIGTALTRDFNYTFTQATFAVDLANGTYTVTLQLGDMVYAHQGMGISFQGTQVDNVSNAAGQILTRSYTVTVTNGQLDLGLSALGGLNTAAVIEGMEIVTGSPPPPPMQYDFGTSSSPVVAGYAGVTETTTYNAAAGYGWLPGSGVASADRGTGTDLTRDFNYTFTQATFAVDLANGTYTVTLQMGDTVYAHQGMGVSFQGVQVDNLSNAAGQILTRSYTVTVTNGQLDLGLSAMGGLNSAAVIEGMEIVKAS